MESLLCDEEWLSSPAHEPNQSQCNSSSNAFHYKTKEELEEATRICLHKELSYMPEPGYVNHLHSNDLVPFRFRAVHWLIKARSRFSLQLGIVFNAANYLDRFLSTHRCYEWKYWMIELVSVACLSIASKLDGSDSPSLHEITQMEDLGYSFEPSTIGRMEMTILHSLGWRLGSITTHSYLDLIFSNFCIDSLDSPIGDQLATPLTNLLLGALLDVEMLEYQPSVIAVSALQCSLDDQFTLSRTNYTHATNHITSLFNQKEKDDVGKCYVTMKSSSSSSSGLVDYIDCGRVSNNDWPASPVTVLFGNNNNFKEQIGIHDSQVDLSIFNQQQQQMPSSSYSCSINLDSCNKKKRRIE